MGAFLKLVDAVLFLFFVVIAVAAPLIDAQMCLPAGLLPDLLVDLNNWYTREYGDYLVAEKPHFFVGIVWLELLFQWPLALLNLYGILGGKPWFNTTCLIYGVSCFTCMVILSLICFAKFHSTGKVGFFFFSLQCYVLLGPRFCACFDILVKWVHYKISTK